ncbi:MAG: hypothetical protein Q8P61_05805 [Candidatus Nanopelagicales bacterium]|nr:hypothetical protein [Candidatus Nanopelagicales bacterium]
MRTETQPVLTGADHARVSMIAADDVGRAVGEQLLSRPGFSARLHLAGDPDATALARTVEGGAESAVLVLAHTESARAVAESIAGMSRGRSDTGRLRVWPAFVAGSPADLVDFDKVLDELPPGSADLVLVLTEAPSPEAVAEALFAWLTVKLPAPASVLGQLPDATGRTCRYVALGLSAAAAGGSAEAPAASHGIERAGESAGDVPDGPADQEVEIEALAFELADRLESEFTTAAPVVRLRDARVRLNAAVDGLDPIGALAAERELTLTAALDISTVISDAVRRLDGDSARRDDDQVRRSGAHVGQNSDQAASELARAVAEFALLAGKSGWGRMMAKRRLVAARDRLAAAADLVVEATESRWSESAAEQVHAAAEARVRESVAAAVAESARKAQLDADQQAREDHQELVVATRSGQVWNRIDEGAVERVWGGGLPEPRRYLIGGNEVTDSVVDLTDPAHPCLRVTSEHFGDQARVLVAQYGLSLPALS